MPTSTLRIVVAGETRGLKKAMDEVERDTTRAGRAADRAGRDFSGMGKRGRDAGRDVQAAGGHVRGFSTAVKAAGVAVLGSGLVRGIKEIADAGAESEASQARLVSQLQATGVSYRAHRAEIDRVIQGTSKLAALDDEDLQDAFTAIERATGKVSVGLRGTAIAADVARGRHMDVAKAGEVVAKVANGNTGILKRYGIAFDPVTKAVDKLRASNEKYTPEQLKAAKAADQQASATAALAALQSRYAGQAEAYGNSSAGAYDRLGVSWENLEETAAGALAPALSTAAGAAGNFIEQLQTGEGAGGRVADVFGQVAHSVEDVARAVAPAAGELAHLGGGFLTSEAGAVALTAAAGALTGRLVAMPIATAVTKVAQLAGGVKAAGSAFDALKLAIARNPVGIIATGLGLAIGALIGFRNAQSDAKVSTQDFNDALDRQRDIMRRIADLDIDLAQRRANVKSATAQQAAAERELSAARKDGDPVRVKQAEAGLEQARANTKRATRDLARYEKDASDTRREGRQETEKNATTVARRLRQMDSERDKLREEIARTKEKINLTKDGGATDEQMAGYRRHLRDVTDKLNTKTAEYNGTLRNLPKSIRTTVELKLGNVGLLTRLESLGRTMGFDPSKWAEDSKRAGGLIGTYSAGGLVPSLVSSGEMLYHQGRAAIVPGARTAADNVFAMLPRGTEVYTDHGQQLLAAGASRDEALDHQLPHFAAGGKVGYTVYDDPPPGAFGALDNGYAELGTARRTDGRGTGRGWLAKALGRAGELPANFPLTVTINGRTKTLRKRDRGYGQGGDGVTSDSSYALDVWKDSWGFFGLNASSKGTATVSAGGGPVATAATAGRPGGSRSRAVLGDAHYSGSALNAGFDAGIAGAKRTPADLLREIISGTIATRQTVAAKTSPSTRSSSRPGSTSSSAPSGAGLGDGRGVRAPAGAANWQGKPVAPWIWDQLDYLKRNAGVTAQVNEGWRSLATQQYYWDNAAAMGLVRGVTVAAPGSSKHGGLDWNRGAVDVNNWQQLRGALGRQKNNGRKLTWYGPKDQVHFSATGHRAGGIIGRHKTGGIAGAIGNVLDAKPTDKSTTTAAFADLARQLAAERTTFNALAHVIADSVGQAGLARAAGQRVDARRLDAIANLARSQVGIRLAQPVTRVTAVNTSVDASDQRQAQIFRLHGIDPSSAAGTASLLLQGQTDLTQLTGGRSQLVKALDRAKRFHATKAIGEISTAITQLDSTILERQASLADLQRELPRARATERIAGFTSRLSALGLDEQQAAFTLGGADDRAIAGRRRQLLLDEAGAVGDELGLAQGRGDKQAVEELTQQLIQLRGEIHDLDGTLKYGVQDERIGTAQTAQIIAQVDTPGDLSDDLGALNDELAAATEAYNRARADGDQEAIRKYGQEVTGLRSSIDQLNTTIDDTATKQQHLTDLLAQVADNQQKLLLLAQAEPSALMGALIAALNGGIGEAVHGGLNTPMYAGTGVRY